MRSKLTWIKSCARHELMRAAQFRVTSAAQMQEINRTAQLPADFTSYGI
jgi:hypothetical protein